VWITLLVAWQSSLPENANMTPTAAAGPITAAAPTSTAENQAKTACRRAGHVAPLRHRRFTGSVPNQATLAKTIGISTTPLREALRRLKVEGLVQLDAHGMPTLPTSQPKKPETCSTCAARLTRLVLPWRPSAGPKPTSA
jgi:hypothetical protein